MIYDANALIEEMEQRYPNDALRIDDIKTEKEKIEYVGKLKLIREMKALLKKKEGGE
jgi:hypothetical protein